MAFLQKVGNLVKQSTGASSALYQAVRCMSSSKLFIGGISYARIIMDRETGRSRGFGFVTYTSTEEATNAITGMDGKDLQGRIVRVSYAHDRGSRAGGGGYGGGGYSGGGYGGYGGGGGGGYSGGGGGGYSGGGGYGGGSYGGGGGYASGGGGYNDGGNIGSGYNTGGSYGVSQGGQGGYGVDAGYTGGYNAAPGSYPGESFNQGGGTPSAYGGGNYGASNNTYAENAPNNAAVGKLDDLISDLKVDGAGEAEGQGEDLGFADEGIKEEGQDEFAQDDFKDEDEPNEANNK
nr:unnamed protein product [Digitaria exilis]